MKIEDIDLRELLSFAPEGGAIQLLGERALIINSFAQGLLRKELIDSLGIFAARSILTRFGYANGWRTAMNIHANMPPEVWKESKGYLGSKLHSLTGMLGVHHNIRTNGEGNEPLISSTWNDCYEAEQHLLHIGKSHEPVCWTEVAFASGYSSYVEGREVIFIEDKCCAKGDASCHVTARFKDKWGPEIEPHLVYYRMESFPTLIKELSDKLQYTEIKLKKREKQLAYLEGTESPPIIMGKSESMKKIINIAWRIAKVDSSVLITGDSGVGKELMAHFIHDQSGRAARPFVAFNCGALTETLLESELFGHAKGSFTGADKDRVGLFESAIGGTLFLDEIGEVSPGMQVKLLRALQEKEVRRVGENRSRPINVRVVAATNRNLSEEIKAGRFRQDLYYRLRVIELNVPPLSDRYEDILPLARFFLNKISHNLGRTIIGFTPNAANQLLRYNWPGNVRELQNTIEFAVAMCQDKFIDTGDLPCELQAMTLKPVVSECIRPLDEIERDYILGVLRAVEDNKAVAATKLNIGLATLYRKLKEYEEQDSKPAC